MNFHDWGTIVPRDFFLTWIINVNSDTVVLHTWLYSFLQQMPTKNPQWTSSSGATGNAIHGNTQRGESHSCSLGYSRSGQQINGAFGHGNWGEFNEWLFTNVLAGVRKLLRDSEAPGDSNIEEPFPPLNLKGLKEGAVLEPRASCGSGCGCGSRREPSHRSCGLQERNADMLHPNSKCHTFSPITFWLPPGDCH